MSSEVSQEFCARITHELREPLAGTAPSTRNLVFITWPKRLWERDALTSGGGFPNSLAEDMHLWSAQVGKVTIRLITNGAVSSEFCEVLIFPENVRYTQVLPSALSALLSAHFSSEPIRSQEPILKPQVMVCTHGKYDKCCAKFGGEVVRTLRMLNEKHGGPLDIWESSHLGGHRFAGTLLTFPQGRAYGYLRPEQMEDWLEHTLSGRVYGPGLRGSLWLEGIEQVAEAFAHQIRAEQQWNLTPQVEHIEEISAQERKVSLSLSTDSSTSSSPAGILELVLHLTEFVGPKGCDALEAPESRMRWTLTDSSWSFG